MSPPRFTLAQDREDAGLSLGQVARFCAGLGRPEVTVERLRRLEADCDDEELATWLRLELYNPLPDGFREALAAWDVGKLRELGAVICTRRECCS